MTENELFAFVAGQLELLMREHGAPETFEVVRGFQTTQQGRTEAPCIYIARQDLHQYGSPRDSYEKDPVDGSMLHINEQKIILQIQFQGSVTYDPQTGLRVGDLLNLASRIMGTPMWRNSLLTIGVQMLRIITNRMTYVQNDRDQFEAVPILLADFCYTDRLVTKSPVVTSIDYKIKRV